MHSDSERFRWVALQMDIICEQTSDRAIIATLDTLPVGIAASYEHILQNINGKNESVRNLVRRTLHWVVKMGRLKARALREAVSIEPDSKVSDPHAIVDLDSILRYCGSYVRKTVGPTGVDVVELSHFAVEEFLTSDSLKKNVVLTGYAYEPTIVERYMACTCLTYLCYPDFGTNCSTSEDLFTWEERFPFRVIAVLN